MKIALVNYRYFISGGPERYYFNIKEILERNGHVVIPFSVKSSKNRPTEYERYFLESVGDEEYFARTRKTPRTVFKSFTRMFYSFEARRKFGQLLRDTRPDVVYIMQYHNKISPSIIDAARSLGIPVVHRISDFQYMCPDASFYNDRTGVCEDCLHGHRMSCIRYRCVMGSAFLSAVKAAAKLLHDSMHVTRRIDAFVVPTAFTAGKLAEYGIPRSKLNVIPTFFNLKDPGMSPVYEPFALYVGRIERMKGLGTLVDAFAGTPYRLKIIGFSNTGYEERLKERLGDTAPNIEFLGRMEFDRIAPYLESCLFTVVPSEWYDNFPNSVLESFAYAKAVIATDFGSLATMIDDHVNGLRFRYGDTDDLRRCVAYMFDNPGQARQMGANARRTLLEQYTPQVHYDSLITLLDRVVSSKSNASVK